MRVQLLAFVKYTYHSVIAILVENAFFLVILETGNSCFVQNLLIFVYLFCPENRTAGSRKTSLTRCRVVVQSCPTPC